MFNFGNTGDSFQISSVTYCVFSNLSLKCFYWSLSRFQSLRKILDGGMIRLIISIPDFVVSCYDSSFSFVIFQVLVWFSFKTFNTGLKIVVGGSVCFDFYILILNSRLDIVDGNSASFNLSILSGISFVESFNSRIFIIEILILSINCLLETCDGSFFSNKLLLNSFINKLSHPYHINFALSLTVTCLEL